jgi:hypothetical protein
VPTFYFVLDLEIHTGLSSTFADNFNAIICLRKD